MSIRWPWVVTRKFGMNPLSRFVSRKPPKNCLQKLEGDNTFIDSDTYSQLANLSTHIQHHYKWAVAANRGHLVQPTSH